MVEEILKHNKEFVARGDYKQYETSKYPDKKIAIVSCMDTRLTELLPAALGIKNGDVKIIKNAGGEITPPFGSAVRSLLVAIYELGVEEVLVIGHTDCGVQSMDPEEMIRLMKERGVSEKQLAMMDFCGIDFQTWLHGFETIEKSVQESVELLRRHPLIPKDVKVYGFVMDSTTGELYPQ